MFPDSRKISAFALIELLLAIALCALAIQLVPVLDIQNWSRSAWMIANAGLLATLLAVRFLPDAIVDWRARRIKQTHQQDVAVRQKAKERREALEQIRQSRKRRLY